MGREAPAASSGQHPLEVGANAMCVRGDPASASASSQMACEVIERECVDGSWRYYVHYHGTDRRLDEWVHEKQLREEQFWVEQNHKSSCIQPSCSLATRAPYAEQQPVELS